MNSFLLHIQIIFTTMMSGSQNIELNLRYNMFMLRLVCSGGHFRKRLLRPPDSSLVTVRYPYLSVMCLVIGAKFGAFIKKCKIDLNISPKPSQLCMLNLLICSSSTSQDCAVTASAAKTSAT